MGILRADVVALDVREWASGFRMPNSSPISDRREAAPFGFWTLVCLVFANMVGVGVFTTSGYSLKELGSPWWVMTAWAVAGLIALCGAWSYSRLIQAVPQSGGEYMLVRRAFGSWWGFLAGWISLIAGFTGAIAIAATAFESYMIPETERPAWLPPDLLACAALLVAGLMHGWKLRWGAVFQNGIVLLKAVLIAIFIAVAAAQWSRPVWRGAETAVIPEMNTAFWLQFATAVVWISFSYSGFNAAIYVVEESRAATKNVPRALMIGTLVVFAVYMLLNLIFVFAPAHHDVAGKEDVATITAGILGGPALANLVRGLIAVALLTSVASMIMAGPRVYAKMADDGLFPEAFRFQGDVPRIAIAVQVVLAIGIVLISTLHDLLSFLSITLSLSAAATVASVFWQSKEQAGRIDRLLAGVFVLSSLGFALLLAVNEPRQLLGTAVTIATGAIVYWFSRRLFRTLPSAD